ncbi:MAG: hypothetical protein ABI867_07575 [Kofleriaceae bacterium]
MRILLLVGMLACSASPQPEAPKVGGADTPAINAHGSGRDRWRGGGVYLDGQPIGVLRYGELPTGLAPVWETQRHRLPFKPGEAIRYEETKVPRYRITDYLAAVGVKLDDVVEVHMHGGRDSAIVLTREDLRRHPDEVMFKFAADTFGKPIPILRAIKVGTRFDDLMALTIYVKREPPHLTKDQTLELAGIPVKGIPYHGDPLREGVRVYVDNRLAAVLKRNQLTTAGQVRWKLADVLRRQGVTTDKLARVELIHDEARTATLAWSDLEFAFNAAASGEIMLGDQALRANSIALFTSS